MAQRTAVIDRIEKGIATVIPDDGAKIFTTHVTSDFFEGQTVVLEDTGLRPARPEEMPKRNNEDRLKNLFNK